ncbi:hypothetical protein AMD26_019120 [Deinococcus sp. UR1]|nr:hypothetical protein AMD26_019120 [Deinococcus sp. UR1]
MSLPQQHISESIRKFRQVGLLYNRQALRQNIVRHELPVLNGIAFQHVCTESRQCHISFRCQSLQLIRMMLCQRYRHSTGHDFRTATLFGHESM